MMSTDWLDDEDNWIEEEDDEEEEEENLMTIEKRLYQVANLNGGTSWYETETEALDKAKRGAATNNEYIYGVMKLVQRVQAKAPDVDVTPVN